MSTVLYEKFIAQVDRSGGLDACHPWIGTRFRDSYGRFHLSRTKSMPAHRWLLGYLRGEPLEPQEWALHHCDNRPCCNPMHLYIGDVKANHRDMLARNRQINVLAMRNATKTHCKHGHEFTPENTYIGTGWMGRPRRNCRTCNRIAAARYHARQKMRAEA